MNDARGRIVRNGERGQVLVITVFAIVVLLAAVGLAVDGGTAYLERRRMQNAADASALAGTRRLAEAICGSQSASATDAAIYAEVLSYAQSNGVQDASGVEAEYVRFDGVDTTPFDPPVLVGGGATPTGAAGVRVTSAITRSTYFLGLIGLDTTGARASATAVAGPPLTGGGMRPFGVPLEVARATGVGGCFTSNFKHCDVDKPDSCWIKDDDENVVGQHRNWLNLNHVWNQGEASASFPRATGSSGNAAQLKSWMRNGWDGTLYADCYWSAGCRYGDFIHAKPGTNSSVIGETPINEEFVVPVFDVVPHYSTIPSPKASAVPQGGDYYYHIVGFLTVVVPPGGANQGGGTIRMCVRNAIWGQGQPNPNTGFGNNVCAAHTMVVALWK